MRQPLLEQHLCRDAPAFTLVTPALTLACFKPNVHYIALYAAITLEVLTKWLIHHNLPVPSCLSWVAAATQRNAVSLPRADDRRCLSCGVQFESREEQVAHYKLDWHKYNVKRKLVGLPCVEEDAFEAMSGVSFHMHS